MSGVAFREGMVCKVYKYTTFYPDWKPDVAELSVAKHPSSQPQEAVCSYVGGFGEPAGWHKGFYSETEVDVTVGFNAKGDEKRLKYSNCKYVGSDTCEGHDPRGMGVELVLLKEYTLKPDGAGWRWDAHTATEDDVGATEDDVSHLTLLVSLSRL